MNTALIRFLNFKNDIENLKIKYSKIFQ
jgi:hypothetical protein